MIESVAKSRKKAWAAVTVVFVAGLLLGGLVTGVLIRNHVIRVMKRDRPPVHEMVARRLIGNLDLGASQSAELTKILGEYGPRFEKFNRSSREEVRSIAVEMEARIRTILTPAQQERYDENIKRMHERFRKRDRKG